MVWQIFEWFDKSLMAWQIIDWFDNFDNTKRLVCHHDKSYDLWEEDSSLIKHVAANDSTCSCSVIYNVVRVVLLSQVNRWKYFELKWHCFASGKYFCLAAGAKSMTHHNKSENVFGDSKGCISLIFMKFTRWIRMQHKSQVHPFLFSHNETWCQSQIFGRHCPDPSS